ncbi:unannotated protein [freshwater metagenome]|uniref:Unannotated protein n=1 Tax=freshwater metagenome TaxID=449393 RepID=A0A6J6SES7_9ZZZZ
MTTPGLHVLAEAAAAAARADAAVVDAVAAALGSGATWADVGKVFGVSRQAAWERFAAKVGEL